LNELLGREQGNPTSCDSLFIGGAGNRKIEGIAVDVYEEPAAILESDPYLAWLVAPDSLDHFST
jgi:hypothetical protein